MRGYRSILLSGLLSLSLMTWVFAGSDDVSIKGESEIRPAGYVGMHQYDTELHKGYVKPLSEQPPKGLQAIPLNPLASPGVNRIVFGYMPYWTDTNTYIDWMRFNLITHVAWHSVEIASNGVVTNPNGWPNNYLLTKAHASGTKVLLSATNFSTGSTFLASNSARYTSCTALLKLVQNAGGDGITIDIEALTYTASVQSTLSKYMQEISTTFHNANAGYHVSMAINPLQTGAASTFNLDDLSDYCDSIFVMWYDYNGSWSGTTGPGDPFARGGYYSSSYSMLSKVNAYIQQNNFRPSKIVMGFPLYGIDWITSSNAPNAAVDSYVGHPLYGALPRSGSVTSWDTASQTPWAYNGTLSVFTQTWYGSPDSLGMKYDLVNNLGLGGIGFWALTYDYPSTQFWDVLSTKFFGVSTSAQGIKNGNFENARSVWANWEYGTSTLSPKTTLRSGSQALVITATGASGAAFYQSEGRIQGNGDSWTLGAWIYQSGFGSGSCNWGWAGSYSPYTKSPHNVNVASGGTWSWYTVAETFSDRTVGYRDVQVTLTGTGTVYIDDVTVQTGTVPVELSDFFAIKED